MKRTTFLALAMSLGLAMSAEQAGATVANPGLAAAGANAKQTAAVTKVWWRGGYGGYGPGWHGGYGSGWRGYGPGYGWRPGYGWAPFAVFGAAVAATAAAGAYYGPGPYYGYGPGPYGPCGGGPCGAPPPPAPLK